jgi:hypothetical protein
MSDPTPEQILTVLNDGEPVDYAALEWCVITGGYAQDIDRYGNLVERDTVKYWPFEQGELLLLNENGREPFGEGRKPGKWSVTAFDTRDYEQALALSQLIKANPDERGMWEWADGAWTRCVGPMPRRHDGLAWLGKQLDNEERAGWTQ